MYSITISINRLSLSWMLLSLLLSAPVLAEEEAGQVDPYQPIRSAWEQAHSSNRSVMLVLGAEWCDRCALLQRYMNDEDLQARIDQRFVVMHLDVGRPDSLITMESDAVQLPVIVLLDSAQKFESQMQSSNLLTFLPEPYEPLYDWLENVLFYTEQTLALKAG